MCVFKCLAFKKQIYEDKTPAQSKSSNDVFFLREHEITGPLLIRKCLEMKGRNLSGFEQGLVDSCNQRWDNCVGPCPGRGLDSFGLAMPEI